jgi:methylenetetrahydrofolate reductase (NADPH)
MLIKDILKNKKPLISFEIFPPKISSPIEIIYRTIDELSQLKPDFISVTYGAGGSTKDTTVDVTSYITKNYNITALAHLTCLTSTKEDINNILTELENRNLKNILALRGDYPKDADPSLLKKGDFRFATDLIKYIKINYPNFCIGAACYPEKHLEAPDIEIDLKNLKKKVDSGVDFLITQLFFDNKAFYNFLNKAEQLGINIPIIPGIFPVLNSSQINRIVSLSGCAIPPKLADIFEKYSSNPKALRDAGIAYAVEQIVELLSWDISGIHIYTMNKPKTTKRIMSDVKKNWDIPGWGVPIKD